MLLRIDLTIIDMDKEVVISEDPIMDKIYKIRGVSVMLDRDLAKLYGLETRALKQAVNRNKKRFPSDFMFVLIEKEIDVMVSQNVIPSKKHLGGALPYAFTEQGVANLSSVLTSKKAIEVNIHIMRSFVAMRKFMHNNAELFSRVDSVERKQLEFQCRTDNRFEQIFRRIEDKSLKPEKGIFFEGQIFDTYTFISNLIRSARISIIVIDNYIDDSVLTLFSKTDKGVKVVIYTNNITKRVQLDVEKYNAQYSPISIKEFKKSHDRFLIIDNKEVYHLGASLKDLGKKWFAFSKFDKDALHMLGRLEAIG